MPPLPTVDGLSVTQEGTDVRVRADGRSFLFGACEQARILEIYGEAVDQAERVFTPRWAAVRGPNLEGDELARLARAVALHWMYFYIVNRLPVRITAGDWAHPQTLRLIQAAVEARFSPSSEEAALLCAALSGLSREAFLSWKAGDEIFLNR